MKYNTEKLVGVVNQQIFKYIYLILQCTVGIQVLQYSTNYSEFPSLIYTVITGNKQIRIRY